jgi:hypothetical protein
MTETGEVEDAVVARGGGEGEAGMEGEKEGDALV